MRPTYYQIDLTGRMLTALLVALALLLVLSFAFGYGAAWSVLSQRQPSGGQMTALAGAEVPDRTPTPTPTAVTRRATPRATPTARPVVPQATARPVEPTATPRPLPTSTPRPRPTETTAAAQGELWVQVLAVGRRNAIDAARAQLVEIGFPREHHRVIQTQVAGGELLYKLRVGPFPDQASASRVMTRMRRSGFPDAWVVRP